MRGREKESGEALIRVEGLTRLFGETRAVDGLTFEVGEGEVFGLLGPNGAGKTTTIRILSTVIAPHSGRASVNGFDVAEHPEKVRSSLGVLTTQVGLYERFTARENVEYFARLYGMPEGEIGPRVTRLFQTLDALDFQDRRASGLSTGMRQKVAIARSVVHDPPVIIFDEPTLGLDVLASQTVRDFIEGARRQGKTVVLSTHDMHRAEKMCERLAVLHQGRLLACGSPREIMEEAGASSVEEAFVRLVEGEGGAGP